MSRRHTLRAALVACAVGLLGLVPASAQQVFTLDDSASPRSRVDARLEDSPLQQRSGPIVHVRFGRIDYRLATAAYMGRRARIFYVLPPVINGLLSPAGLPCSGKAATCLPTAPPGPVSAARCGRAWCARRLWATPWTCRWRWTHANCARCQMPT